ncbi:MAG: hypothetical protein WC852_02830 [Candidatus Nanoarchaeia archaeon]|jgi:hypothetical protein
MPSEIISEYKRCVAALEEAEKDLNSENPKNISALESMLSAGTPAMRMLQRHHSYGPRLQEVVGKMKEYRERKPAGVSIADKSDYLLLKDVCCTDVDGNVFESYDELFVNKNLEKNQNGELLFFTPYNGAAHFEKQAGGLFLPSFALSCNILAALWQNKGNPECERILLMYKNKGNGNGWHCQNTVVDYAGEKIIHYPFDSDFPNDGGVAGINSGRKRIVLPFQNKSALKDEPLEQALQHAASLYFIRQFTGLKNPEALVEIGKYLGKEAKVWFPDNAAKCKNTRAAWLGCGNYDFDLCANNSLDDSNAARGVRS